MGEKAMSRRITVAGIGELLWDVVGDSEQLGGAHR